MVPFLTLIVTSITRAGIDARYGQFVVLIVIWSLAFFVLLLRAVYVVFFKP